MISLIQVCSKVLQQGISKELENHPADRDGAVMLRVLHDDCAERADVYVEVLVPPLRRVFLIPVSGIK